jgi:FkbM family methyltransferase
LWSIFVKDTKKLAIQKEQELQERLKQTTDEKEQTVKQLQEEQTKVQEVTENFTKSKEELEALKKLTTQKEQELQEKLKQATQAKELTVKQLQEEQTKVQKLTQDIKKTKEELDIVQTKLKETKVYFENRKKESIENKEIVSKQKKEIERLKKRINYSSDAKIDQFINDITPFFYNRSITYVDIGAFVGEVFMKINDLGTIAIREAHLFEPNPTSYKILKENIQGYQISSIHSYNIGLGEKKEKSLFSSAKSMTKKYDNLEVDINNSTNVFEAEILPLDEFTSLITEGHIHLLKIDTEGMELNVFEGAKSFLEAQKIDIIYMEVGFNKSGTQQTYFCKLDQLLQNYGYRVLKFYEQTNEWIDDMAYLRRCNVAYISSRFAESNPYKLSIENSKLKEEIKNLQNKKEEH